MSTAQASSSLAPAVTPSSLPAIGAKTGASPHRLFWVAVVAAVAVGLRTWNISAVFETSDQAAMSHILSNGFGIKWIFAHDYGPVLPVLQRGFAEVLSAFDVPLSEASVRWPIVLLSLGQVGITFPLLRRLGRSPAESLAGSICCAVLPTLVSDAHYGWAYMTVWFFFGTVAVWATLAHIDDRRPWQLTLAAGALFLHCLSGFYALAVPLTVLAAWWLAARGPSSASQNQAQAASGQRLLAPAIIGFVLPCVAALTVIALSWLWTGQGQIGRILGKQSVGGLHLQLDQVLELPRVWVSQLGIIFGPVAALGLAAGTIHLLRPTRYGLLALWVWAGLLPIVLVDDWACTGYANYHLFEPLATCGILGAVWLCRVCRTASRWRRGLALTAILAFAQLTLADVDVCIADNSLRRLTGIHTGWGDVRGDTGIKAAGWYVRKHVPIEAIVMTLHTRDGMEVPVAQYYTGRSVLAHYDLLFEALEPLLDEMREVVDVVIADTSNRHLLEALADFECVCTLDNRGEPVRLIYARETLALPELDAEVSAINARYDREYRPRHLPLVLAEPDDFLTKLARYQETVRRVQGTRFTGTRP